MDMRQRTVKPDGISFSEARSSDPAGTSQTATETLESAKRFRWKEVRTGGLSDDQYSNCSSYGPGSSCSTATFVRVAMMIRVECCILTFIKSMDCAYGRRGHSGARPSADHCLGGSHRNFHNIFTMPIALASFTSHC